MRTGLIMTLYYIALLLQQEFPLISKTISIYKSMFSALTHAQPFHLYKDVIELDT